MSLSTINLSELRETGFTSGNYKGFDVFVNPSRHGFTFSVLLLLESDSDACHIILSNESANTLSELKEMVMEAVNNYPYSAKELLTLHPNYDLDNQYSRKVFVKEGVKVVEGVL